MSETISSPDSEPDDVVHEYLYPQVRELPRVLWAVEFDDFIGPPPPRPPQVPVLPKTYDCYTDLKFWTTGRPSGS